MQELSIMRRHGSFTVLSGQGAIVQKMTRPTFSDFKKKALKNPKVRAEYEELELAYELREQLFAPPPSYKPISM
ncbi:hypothetical protein [Endozoicomonas sp. 4G]|uniref:hypothetical protein n=1 Tax=Endozoicomonas sp. 4G TaxID=2872754 RepID=UPI002078C48D|nr:hypothetical protein [Endozoicomonas sp. 4G]